MTDYDTIEEVHRMHEAGANHSQIGRALNLPRSTVDSIMRRPIPQPTEDRTIVRRIANGGWSTANHCVSYIAMPRIRALEAANDNDLPGAITA